MKGAQEQKRVEDPSKAAKTHRKVPENSRSTWLDVRKPAQHKEGCQKTAETRDRLSDKTAQHTDGCHKTAETLDRPSEKQHSTQKKVRKHPIHMVGRPMKAKHTRGCPETAKTHGRPSKNITTHNL